MQSDDQLTTTNAILKMLTPLMRLSIGHEVTYPEFVELVQIAYVEAAEKHFRVPDSEMTNARIAVLTGMARRRVKKAKDLIDTRDKLKPKLNRAQRAVQGWLSDSEFLDKQRKPKVLPINKTYRGKERGSFVALVKRYSGDISHGVILEELNNEMITHQPDPKSVALVDSAYIPKRRDAEKARVISKCVADLFNVALHNIETDESKPHLQRQIVFSHIDEDLVENLQGKIEVNAKELIDSLNTLLKSAREKSGKKNIAQRRVGLGLYYIEEEHTGDENKEK